MARITIVIEDKPGNKVQVTTTPKNEELLQKVASHGPSSMTSAEAYVLFVCRQLREESQRQGATRILVPRIGR